MTENETVVSSSCPHTWTEKRVINSEYFKRQFVAEVDECRNCGAQVWTRETRHRFHQWMLELKHERRDVFQIQFYLTDSAREALKDLLKSYPGVKMSALIRAITSAYLNSMIRFQDFQSVSHQILELSSYRRIADGVRKKTCIQFSPIALLDVQAWGEILKLSPHKVVEDATYKCLALKIEPDTKLRSHWEQNLWPQIEVILRSV